MLVSNYTFLFEHQGNFFAFNSLSRALIELNRDIYLYLQNKQTNKDRISDGDLEIEVYKELERRLFICKSLQDEFLIYKSIITEARKQDNFLHLTIAPTMDCCFNCFYCFEKNKTKSYITEEIIDSIVKNIQKRSTLQSMHLTWFGGEPLMAIDKMALFHKKFRVFFQGSFSSNIITTAFHINPSTIKILKDIEVKSMQITLDGLENTHNAIKFTKGCNNAFQQTLNNIDSIIDIYPELNISIRVNTTKKNQNEYIPLYNYISNRYSGKVSIAPGLVMNRTNDDSISGLFNHKDFTKFSLNLWKNHRIITPWLMYKDFGHIECAIRNKNALSVDPDGHVYQCWENIGIKKRAIGKLNKNG